MSKIIKWTLCAASVVVGVYVLRMIDLNPWVSLGILLLSLWGLLASNNIALRHIPDLLTARGRLRMGLLQAAAEAQAAGEDGIRISKDGSYTDPRLQPYKDAAPFFWRFLRLWSKRPDPFPDED